MSVGQMLGSQLCQSNVYLPNVCRPSVCRPNDQYFLDCARKNIIGSDKHSSHFHHFLKLERFPLSITAA
jgi:hypothetical protein